LRFGLFVRRLVVEALGRHLAKLAVPEPDLEVELVAEAMDGIDGDEGEATLLDRRLVDHLAPELCGRSDRAADERQAPDQGHVAAAPAVRAPAPDHVVVEVYAPLRVLLGRDVREVRLRPDVARLGILLARERHPAEVLDRRVPAAAAGGNVDSPTPGALRKPLDRRRIERRARLTGMRLAGRGERLAQPLAPAPVGPSLLRRIGDEAREGTGDRRHGRRQRIGRQPSASRRSAAARSGA